MAIGAELVGVGLCFVDRDAEHFGGHGQVVAARDERAQEVAELVVAHGADLGQGLVYGAHALRLPCGRQWGKRGYLRKGTEISEPPQSDDFDRVAKKGSAYTCFVSARRERWAKMRESRIRLRSM